MMNNEIATLVNTYRNASDALSNALDNLPDDLDLGDDVPFNLSKPVDEATTATMLMLRDAGLITDDDMNP